MFNFDKVKAAFGDVTARDREITRKIGEAEEKIASLEKNSPLQKADYIAANLAAIDRMAELYLVELQLQVDNDLKRAPLDFVEPNLFAGFNPGTYLDPRIITPGALCALVGPLIKKEYSAVVEKLNWPKDCGPSLADRTKLIANLREEIARLYEEQIELRRLAAESGLALGVMTEDHGSLTKAQKGARAKLAADEAKGKAMIHSGY